MNEPTGSMHEPSGRMTFEAAQEWLLARARDAGLAIEVLGQSNRELTLAAQNGSLEQVSVQLSDEGRSVFQMGFRIGRDHTLGIVDYPHVLEQLVRPGYRVVLTSVIDAVPHVLVDGIITNLQLSPSIEPSGGKLSVSGQDLSILMEQQEFKLPKAPVTDQATVLQILTKYASYGIVPVAIPAPGDKAQIPTKQVGVSDGTDSKVVTELGRKYNYVFWVQAGPLPTQSLAYWGPPIRFGARTEITLLTLTRAP